MVKTQVKKSFNLLYGYRVYNVIGLLKLACILNVRVTSLDGKPFALSPQISPQNKKIIPLRNGQDSGKKIC